MPLRLADSEYPLRIRPRTGHAQSTWSSATSPAGAVTGGVPGVGGTAPLDGVADASGPIGDPPPGDAGADVVIGEPGTVTPDVPAPEAPAPDCPCNCASAWSENGSRIALGCVL